MKQSGNVRMEGVVKQHGSFTALHGLDLEIRPGEFFALLGPSGSGKTTTLRILAGLESVNAGRVLLDNADVTHAEPGARDVAMVFQSYALYPHLTVAENMAFHMQVMKVTKAEQQAKVQQAARILAIDHLLQRYPKELSGGQRQRVAMGRAMVRNPKVFLFDEPLSNLDAQLRMELRAEIKALHQQFKTTTVYVTHDQIEAMTLADQIVVMKDGNIVQQGKPLEIYDAPADTFVARFIGSPPMNLLDGVVTPRDDRPGVACGELWLPLPAKWRHVVAGSKVILGLRPHDFHLVDTSEQPAAQLRLMEITGDVSLLHINWGGYRLHVQFNGRINAQSDQPLWLAPNRDAIHLFDAATGLRLSES